MPRTAAAACAGRVTPIRSTRQLNNARRLARLAWISTVYSGAGATKTAIQPIAQKAVSSAALRGWRCSDGAPLRFWFGNRELPQHPTARTGSTRLELRFADALRNHFDWVGYFMFWSPGKWVVEARAPHGRSLGTVLFELAG
jgi:hypothetical protein